MISNLRELRMLCQSNLLKFHRFFDKGVETIAISDILNLYLSADAVVFHGSFMYDRKANDIDILVIQRVNRDESIIIKRKPNETEKRWVREYSSPSQPWVSPAHWEYSGIKHTGLNRDIDLSVKSVDTVKKEIELSKSGSKDTVCINAIRYGHAFCKDGFDIESEFRIENIGRYKLKSSIL